MRRQQQTGNGDSNGSNFTVFRVPGSRYAPSSVSSNGSGGPAPGVPLAVGPSLDYQGSTTPHRNSYSSTLPASPPFRESMPDGLGYDDYDSMDNGGVGWMRTGRIVRVKETGQSYRFPLDEENLPQIQLSRQDIAALRESMEAAIHRAVTNGSVSWMENPTMAPANSKYQWKVHLEKKNCIMYRRKNDATLSRNFLIRSKLEGSMDDIMYGVISDNTEDERTYSAHVHRDDFLDSAVLQLLARPNVEDPYQLFAVKWAAFQSPVDSMFAIRDQFYVEYSRTVIDPKGQKVVARVFQSINAKEYHAVERDFGFVRNDINWVQLFRVLPGSNDTKVDVSLAGSVTFPAGANTPSWLANRFLSSMYAIVTGMANAGDAKFIVNNQLVSEKPWVPNHERSACSVCFKSFSLLRHRHHCRICAEIMCTSCTLELALRTSTLPQSLRPEGGLISAEKFCFKCVEQARRDRGISMAHELAMASASEGELDASFDESNKENPGRSSGSYGAYAGHNSYSSQEHDFQARAQTPLGGRSVTRSVSTNSSESSGMNATAWSNKVLTAMSKEKAPGAPQPSTTASTNDLIPLVPTNGQMPMRLRTNTSGPERLRHDLIAADRNYKTTNSLPSAIDVNDLPRESEEVVTVTAMPSTFAKMEESIAVQQMLLRNMMVEGQKIMQQQTQQYYQPPPPAYNAIRSGPQIDVIDDLDSMPRMPPGAPLALPPSTTSEETL